MGGKKFVLHTADGSAKLLGLLLGCSFIWRDELVS